MKIGIKLKPYTPKPVKPTKSAIMRKYMAIVTNEKASKR